MFVILHFAPPPVPHPSNSNPSPLPPPLKKKEKKKENKKILLFGFFVRERKINVIRLVL